MQFSVEVAARLRLVDRKAVFPTLKLKSAVFNAVDGKKDRHSVKIGIVKLAALGGLS